MNKINDELIDSIFALAQDKGLSTSSVLIAIEEAIKEVVGKSKGNVPIDVTINPDNGCINTYIVKTIVEDPEEIYEISLDDANKIDPDAIIGDHVRELLESGNLTSMTFMRTAASTVRKLLRQKISQLEREREFVAFETKEDTIITAKIKRFEFGNIILDLKVGEGYLPESELIPGEYFKTHQEVKAYIYQVKPNEKGPQVFLSRKHPKFLACIFEEIIPEMNDKIFIKSIARDPGSKAKVAVMSTDEDIDAVGSCIGKGGLRIKTIMNEVNNEKIDVLNWSEDLVTFAINAIEPAKVERVIVKDEDDLELIVEDDSIHIAIGRDGQNVKLARKLVKSKLAILSNSEYEARKQESINNAVEEFKSIEMNQETSELLANNDILSLETLKDLVVDDIKEIENINLSDDEISSIIQKAEVQYNKQCEEINEKAGSTIDINICNILSVQDIAKFSSNEIITNNDVANLDIEDMINIFGNKFNEDEIHEIIMSFRNVVFDYDNDDDFNSENEEDVFEENEEDSSEGNIKNDDSNDHQDI